MTGLILGPLLRYTGETEATVWVETDSSCEVEVRADGSGSHRARTFHVEGHNYALVWLKELEPGKVYEYEVSLDGEKVWPEPDSGFPPSIIRTAGTDGKLVLSYGSCRVSVPHEPPYTLKRALTERGGLSGHRFERDALYALAMQMREAPIETWPHALLMLGDQIYADEVSPGTQEFIRSRRSKGGPPEDQVADFEEYTHLYWDSWRDPVVRWLLSTVPSAMIFDDHDVNDDWNISETWVKEIRSNDWWQERIVGAFMSYWIYQHLGNLSPEDLDEDEMFRKVRESEDASHILREFAKKADRETAGTRWSYHRDFGKVRLIVVDSRAGRVVEEERRSMLDDEEWNWVREMTAGDFDHVLIGTSLPLLLSPGLHYMEATSEAVCSGAWGDRASRLGEKVRQAIDLEHWAAFQRSFADFVELLKSTGNGESSPASIVVLSGDVHHGYLARASFEGGTKSAIYQSVCSPLRNPLGLLERFVMRSGWSRMGRIVGNLLGRLAGVGKPSMSWRLVHDEPWFSNHISTIEIEGRKARLRVEYTKPEEEGEPLLYETLDHELA